MALPFALSRSEARNRLEKIPPEFYICCVHCLFDHLVGARPDRGRNGEPQRLGSFPIDRHGQAGRLLNGQVRRFPTAQDLIEIVGGPAPLNLCIWTVGDEPAVNHFNWLIIHGRQLFPQRQLYNRLSIGDANDIGCDN